MRIGVFGGSFDPPHLAHLQVASAALKQLKLNRVLWVPALQSPLKDFPTTSFEHRLGMVQALIQGDPDAQATDIESSLPSPSYTLHTLRALKKTADEKDSWFLIIGADNWSVFPNWHQPDAIMREAALAVYPRQGIPLLNLPPQVTLLDCAEIPMESRQFRGQIQSDPERALANLPVSVAEYIRHHGLYGFSTAATL